ncbi:MAG: hypothetical protein AB7V32_09140, partial [Candidatus Berkiella sp.]
MLSPNLRNSVDLSKMPSYETFVSQRYTRLQAANLLRLVDRLMNPAEPFILKVGHSDQALVYFKSKLLLELDKDETEQSFDELAEKVRNVLTQIEQSPQLKKDSNNHHHWARLYRDAYMNGDVLNLYDMRVLAASRIFSLRLK